MQEGVHNQSFMALAAASMIAGGSIVFGQESTTETPDVLYHTPAEKRDIAGITLLEGVSVGVLLEAEASYGEDAGEDVSDVVLATFELDIDADLNEWVKGHALLLWEEDDTEPLDLDEATITLDGTEAMPAYMSMGKMYVPFGAFNSHFVSDPLVLELGETRESALLAGYGTAMLDLQAAVFNGDLDDGEDRLDNVVLAAILTPYEDLQIGASWISDLGESEALQETIEETQGEAANQVYEEVSGAGAFLSWTPWKLALDIEYIAAMSDFDTGVLGDEALRPLAWNAELAFHSGQRWEVAAKAEGSRNFPGFPEIQYGAVVSIAVADSATFALEFLHGEYDDETGDRNLTTCQFALAF